MCKKVKEEKRRRERKIKEREREREREGCLEKLPKSGRLKDYIPKSHPINRLSEREMNNFSVSIGVTFKVTFSLHLG